MTTAAPRVALRLQPLDTLFFRGGRPFDAANRVEGQLPHPQPLAGALRTTLLARHGFDFRRFAQLMSRTRMDATSSRREERTQHALHDCGAPDWIIHTRFRGPWLAVDRGGGPVEPLLPVPLTLSRAEEGEGKPGSWARVGPWTKALRPWMGPAPGLAPFWRPERPAGKYPDGFLTLGGVREFLAGRVPSDQHWLQADEVYDFDTRTGIGIDMTTLTSAESQIYGIRLLALAARISHEAPLAGGRVCLYAEVLPPPGAPADVAALLASSDHNYGLRRAVELVQGGLIGAVHELHVWTNRPIWPQAPQITSRPKPEEPPPHVHWDVWLGPAPERPYSPAYHPFKWRGWWDFGTGALGDMACHTANLGFRALKLAHPTTVSAESGPINPETYPGWARIVFEFGEREGLPPVKFTWYEGHKDGQNVLPSPDLVKGLRESDSSYSIYFKDGKYWYRDGNKKDSKPRDVSSGCFLIGDKGILFSPDDYGSESFVLRDDKIERVTGEPEKLRRNNGGDDGMKAEWVEAIRGGPPAYSNFDYAALLTETILLGNVAMRVGKKLEWDAEQLKATNCPEADRYINPPCRQGWKL